MDVEDLINECGGLGKFQVLVIFGIMVHKASIGWSMLQMSYAGFIPDWYCVAGPGMDNATFYTNATLKECSINNSYTGYRDRSCYSHHYEGSSNTAITQWDIVCDRKWIKATITSIQMAGVLVGAAVSGQLADLFGRKKVTYGFSLIHVLLNIGAAFSNSWEMFAGFRFFIGIGIGGLLVVTFPYPMEFLPTKWRPLLAIIPVWATSVGIFSITALLVDDWSYLHIACAIIGFPALLGYFYVPESVRWLTMRGRFEDAEKIFEKMAIVNGKIPPKHTRATLEKIYKQEQDSKTKGREYTYLDLFKGKQQVINTLVFCYLWFTLSAVYYGISFGVSALSGNLYLNIFLLAIVELPPQFSTFYFNNVLGRKWTCIGLLIIGVIPACGCWVVYSLVDSDSRGSWITGLSLVSKMGMGAAWSVTSTWVSESYPTVIRSLGYGVVNTAARVGGILAPFAIDLDNAPLTAYAMITSLTMVGIVLSFFVPDTKGKVLADSIQNKNKTTSSSTAPNAGSGGAGDDDVKQSVVIGEINGSFEKEKSTSTATYHTTMDDTTTMKSEKDLEKNGVHAFDKQNGDPFHAIEMKDDIESASSKDINVKF